MAASEVTPILLSRTTGLKQTMDAVTTGNMVDMDSDTGFFVDLGDTTQVNEASKMILFISALSTRSTVGSIKVKSSTNNPFSGSGIPDLEAQLATGVQDIQLSTSGSTGDGSLSMIGPFETARYKDTDGHLNVEYDTGHDGIGVMRAWAALLP